MSLHRASPITSTLADQWATAMACAIAGAKDIDPAIGHAMGEALGHMARGMINFGLDSGAGRGA